MSVETQTNEVSISQMATKGKYLTFALGEEEYGLEILKVREIIGYMDITCVPQTPSYVEGIINLRGKVIPIVDLRSKFGMETVEVSDETCIIVVEVNHGEQQIETGIIVDRVSEVLDISAQAIEPPPQIGDSINTQFILGMGKIGDSVKILLDIDMVLSRTDLEILATTSEEVTTD